MPKIRKLCRNLSKLCLKHCGLFFPGHGVYIIDVKRSCKFEILTTWLYVCLRWVDLESEALLLRNNRQRSPVALRVVCSLPATPRTCHSSSHVIPRQCCSQGDFQPQSKILSNSSLFRVTSTHCDTGCNSSNDWAAFSLWNYMSEHVTTCSDKFEAKININVHFYITNVMDPTGGLPSSRPLCVDCEVQKLLKLYYDLARLCQE